ncbi:DAHL domain-containing protein [Terasakiella sp. SH-1]|uniref:DAHL domain-containing protein n=1 Tax=Terasakiella sp. SH-1 TaxID=2560057 RepID=UPI001073E13B|nr:DAHL domain-containing protein [Terasakiella sp. SH-1]
MKWDVVRPVEWIGLTFVLTALAIVYFQSPNIDGEKHARTLHSVAVLEEALGHFAAVAVETRFGMLPNFDTLVAAQQDANRKGLELKGKIPFEEEQTLISVWQAYADGFSQKQDVVEDFKSHLAILKNSVNYLPVVTREFIAAAIKHQIDPQKIEAARILLVEGLIFSQDYGFEHIEQVNRSLAMLKPLHNGLPAEVDEVLRGVIIHAEAIIEYKHEVDGLLNTMLAIPMDRLVRDVQDTYLSAHQKKLKSVEAYKSFLIALAALLAVMIASLLYRLARSSQKLHETVTQLNFQKNTLDEHAIVSIADVRGRITYVNQKFCDISGYTLEELLGENHRIVKSGEHSSEFFKEMWTTISSGHVWHGVIKNIAKDGREYWVDSTIVPFLNEQKKPFQYVSIRTDITKLKNMETALEKSRDKAEQGSQSKSAFLANMSHEIRTPMNAVIGLSHLLLNTKLDEKQEDYVNKVLSSANILLDIINDILDFSKIEAGKLAFEEIAFNLDDVFDEVMTLTTLNTQKKGLKIRLQRDVELSHMLIGDPLRLKQVLINISSNAVKFTHEGEVTFVIEEVQRTGERVVLQFSVQDTGIGLSAEQIETLFDSFSQADLSTTREYGGTGLGLAICKNLVERMKGQIHVESEKGHGSTFSFTAEFKIGPRLSVLEGEQSFSILNNQVERTQQAQVAEPHDFKGAKVLIVEDNIINQKVAAGLLQRFGLDCEIVNNGKEGVQAARDNRFSAILMDIQMPEMDGVQATVEIRKADTDIPIIAMTAHAMAEEQEKCRLAGMNDYVTKPVDPEQLRRALETWIKV